MKCEPCEFKGDNVPATHVTGWDFTPVCDWHGEHSWGQQRPSDAVFDSWKTTAESGAGQVETVGAWVVYESQIQALKEALTTAVALAAKHSDLWTKDDYQRLHDAKKVLDGCP